MLNENTVSLDRYRMQMRCFCDLVTVFPLYIFGGDCFVNQSRELLLPLWSTKSLRILLQHDYLSSLKSTRKRKMHHANLVRMSCNGNLVSLAILSSTRIRQFGIDSHIDSHDMI